MKNVVLSRVFELLRFAVLLAALLALPYTAVRANQPPTVAAADFSTLEDQPLTDTLVATDPDDDPVTCQISSPPGNGQVVFSTTSPCEFTYTPNPDATGIDLFYFRASDPSQALSNVARAQITITAVNDPPTAQPTTLKVKLNTPQDGTLLATDADGDALQFAIQSPPALGSVEIVNAASGRFRYTPRSGVSGPDTFTFSVIETQVPGSVAASAAVSVSIASSPNRPPIAEPGFVSLREDETFSGRLRASDADGDTLTFELDPTRIADKGLVQVVDETTGAFTYAPDLNAFGADVFYFRVGDGSVLSPPVRVEVDIRAVNDAPVITGSPPTTVESDQMLDFRPLISDADDDPLQIAFTGCPPTPGWITCDTDSGHIRWQPAADGSNAGPGAPIVIEVSDGKVSSTLGPIIIDVLGVTPVTRAAPAGGTFNTTQDVQLLCQVPAVAGACETFFSTDPEADPAEFGVYDGTPITIAETVNLRFFSRVPGADESVQSADFVIDQTPPELTITAPVAARFDTFPNVSGTASDAESPIQAVSVEITDGVHYVTQTSSGPQVTPVRSSVQIPVQLEGSWQLALPDLNWPPGQWSVTAQIADAAGNQVSRSVLFDFAATTDSAATRLSLCTSSLCDFSISSSSVTILPGGELKIRGQLSRLPDSGVSMADRPLTVSVRHPDDSTSTSDARTDDEKGHFTFDLSGMLTTPGRYEVQVDFAGSVLEAAVQLDPSSATLAVLVGESAGYAIVVQGRLDSNDQSGLLSHKLTTDRVNTILKSRGFADDNIRYLRFIPGVESFEFESSSTRLMESITQWARDKLNETPAPLFVIFVGHAGPAELVIDGADTVDPAELKSWLEQLEGGLNPDALATPRIMVLGACYTESFIADLSAPGRVLIASAGSSEESYRGPLEGFVLDPASNEEVPVRSGELFVDLLFKQLALDQSLPQAYKQARTLVESFTQRGGVPNATRFRDNGAQHPFFDDDGNGLGTNRIIEGSGDGVASAEVHLGIADAAAAGGTAPGDDARAHFVQITPTLRLGEGRDEAELFAVASDPGRVAAAWAEVRSPAVILQGQGGTIQLANELHKEPLILENGRHQARCTIDETARQRGCFSVPGRYEVFYFARDTLTDTVSALQRSLVYVDRPGNRPPDAFALIRPIDGATLAPSLALDWSDAVDPDGDGAIVYNVEIARNAEFTDALQRFDDLGTSALALGPDAGLIPGQTYHWRVTAVDRYGATRTSEQAASFTVTDGAQQGIVGGVVYARASARPIANAQITLGGKSIETGADGRFLQALPPGPVTLVVEALGFDPRTVDGTTVVAGAEQALAVPLDASDLSVLGLNLETDEDACVSGQVQGDCSGGASCVFEQASSPEHGSLVGALNAVSGTFTYCPNTNFNGTDRFRFYLRDTDGRRSSEGTATIMVQPRNDAPLLLTATPVPSLPRLTVGVINPTGIRVSALLEGRVQDVDGTDPKGIAITSRDNGLGEWQYSLDGGVQWRSIPFSATIAATLLDSAPATRLRFRPGAAGTAQLEFRAWDQSSGAIAQSSVDTRINGGGSAFSTQLAHTTVAVDAAAGFPLAEAGAFTVLRGGDHFGAMSASGAVGDANRRFKIVSFPRKGELRLLSETTGDFRYRADPDSAGSDSFGFAVYGAAWQSNAAVVSVEITAVNRAPSVEGGSFSTRFDRPLSIQLRASDADGDPLSYAVTPTTFPELQCGALTPLPTGTLLEPPILTYTPSAAGACDENPLQLTVSDGPEAATATLEITVTNQADQPPVANAANFVTAEDKMFRNVLTGSSDPAGKPLVFEIVSGASKGQVTLLHPVTGRFSYTPNLDSTGADSFTFWVRDAGNVSAPATVDIDITPIDDPPRISGKPPPTVVAGETYSFTPDVQEPDDETPVFSFENCPIWADCDPDTGAIVSKDGLPTSEHEGVWRNVTIRVTDGKSVAALPGFDIAVLPDSGAPEIVRSTADGVYNAAQQVELTCYDAAGGTCEIFYTLDEEATSPVFSTSDALRAVAGGGLQIRGEVVGASTGVSTSGTYALSHVVGQPGIVGSANSRHYRALAGAVSADSDGDGTPDIYDLFPNDPSAYLRYTAPIEVDESATLRFITRDEAGNRGAVASASYAIDRTAPEITITAPGVAATVQRILWIGGTVADAGGAGVAELTVEIKDETQYLTPDGTTATPTPLPVDIGDGGEWLLFTGTVPWEPDTVYSITARARDAAGNESVVSRLVQLSNNPVQRPTLLSLELSARRVLVDDTFSVLGKLTRLPDSGLSLAGRPIEITVFEPNGSPLFTTTAHTRDELGNYVLHDLGGFVTKGPHRVSAHFADTALLAASEASATLHVASAPGVAILVQGKRAGAAPDPAHALALDRLRTVLLNRGFIDADINYLGYGAGAGIDGQPTRANVENAIRQWAKTRLLAKPAPLLIALVGYGESEKFAVDSATKPITPLDLATWVTALEKALPAATLTDPRTLLLAANRSGSFLPSLSAPGRIVVTSTSAEGSAYQGPEEPGGARTASRFLNELGIGLAEGRSMATAYNAASAAVHLATRAGGDGEQADEARQQPRLDDNGDGKGSGVLADLGLDGQIAAQSILGIGRPVIRLGVAQVTDTLTLADTQSSAGLWARLGDGTALDEPWVTIRAPADRVAAGTDLQGILPFTRIAFPSFNAARNRWELSDDGFDDPGLYEIAYHVLDERDGSLSAAARSRIYRDAPANRPPGEFVLLAPANDGPRPPTNPSLSWSTSVDPDGDPVTYTVEIAEENTFSNPVYREDGLSVTATRVAFAAGLRDLTTYFWRVLAVDRWGAVRESEPFQFTTENSNAFAPSLEVTTRDASRSDAPLWFVDLQLVGRKDNGAMETLEDQTNVIGTVTRDFATGTVSVTVTASKAGYFAEPKEVTQFKPPPEVTKVDVPLSQQRPKVDLAVTLKATPALPRVGESVNYTGSVTNNGSEKATCVCVSVALVGADFTDIAAPPVCSATPKVCSVSDLDPGDSEPLSISATPNSVSTSASAEVTASAPNEDELNPTDNTKKVMTPVSDPPPDPPDALMPLRAGLNLVSLPVLPQGVTTARALLDHLNANAGVDAVRIERLDAANRNWLVFERDDDGIGFELTPGAGYALTMHGTQAAMEVPLNGNPVARSMDLAAGVNLLGVVVQTDTKAFGLMSQLGGQAKVTAVAGFDPETGRYVTAGYDAQGHAVGTNFAIERGRAYYVMLRSAVDDFELR